MSDWGEAWTMEQYVIELFKTNQTSSPEFDALKRIFGREKLVEIWKKYCRERSQCESKMQ